MFPRVDSSMSVCAWGFLAAEAVEHLGVQLGGFGLVVGVEQAADAELAFGVEVAFAPCAVGGAGLAGVLVVVQNEGASSTLAWSTSRGWLQRAMSCSLRRFAPVSRSSSLVDGRLYTVTQDVPIVVLPGWLAAKLAVPAAVVVAS
jgi:hypothetical protein